MVSKASARAIWQRLEQACGMVTPQALLALDEDASQGIGRRTAQVYLVFCAGHPDIFPVGDVALQNAVGHGLSLGMRPSSVELDAVSAAWSLWRSVAAVLGILHTANSPGWRGLNNTTEF